MKQDERKTSTNIFKSSKNLILSLYKLAPVTVIVGLILLAALIWALTQFTDIFRMGLVLTIVFGVSIYIYIKTNNYGEASLSLVAGILAAFTVEWSTELATLFAIIWISHVVFVMLYQSIKMAAEHENIFRQAAIWIDLSNFNDIETKLRDITKTSLDGMIGPIEAAKIIRLLAYYGHPIEFMSGTLNSIEKIVTVTEVDPETITLFHVDIYKKIKPTNEVNYNHKIQNAYNELCKTAVPPSIFFEAFKKTRRLIFSEDINIEKYFQVLRIGLNNGFTSDDILEYMVNHLNLGSKLTERTKDNPNSVDNIKTDSSNRVTAAKVVSIGCDSPYNVSLIDTNMEAKPQKTIVKDNYHMYYTMLLDHNSNIHSYIYVHVFNHPGPKIGLNFGLKRAMEKFCTGVTTDIYNDGYIARGVFKGGDWICWGMSIPMQTSGDLIRISGTIISLFKNEALNERIVKSAQFNHGKNSVNEK